MRKLKFFLIGLIPGLLLVFFILNKKGASCSGYLPNSRVIAETLSKEMVYSPAFSAEMKLNNVDEKFLKDSIITHGEVDFDRSMAQKSPALLTFWFIQRRIQGLRSVTKNVRSRTLLIHLKNSDSFKFLRIIFVF